MALNIDEILEAIGELGPYQRRIYFLICLPVLFVGALNFSYVFLAATPSYRCFVSGCDNGTYPTYDEPFMNFTIPFDKSSQTFKSCTEYSRISDSHTCESDSFTKDTQACLNGTVFDTHIYESTIVTEFGLTCENSWKANGAQTIYFVGMLIGCFLFGILADVIGRRKTILISITMMCTSGIGTALVPNFGVFNTVRLVNSMASSGLFQTVFVLGIEFVGPSKRVMFGIIGQYFFALGEVMLGLLAWIIRSWRMLQLVISVPITCFMFYYWVVPESIRWLQTKGRHSKVISLLEEIAKANHKTIPLHLLRHEAPDGDIQTSDDFSVLMTRQNKVTILDILKCYKMLIRLVFMIFIWIVTTLVYYGLSYSAVDLISSSASSQPFVNFILSALVELPGYTIAWLGMNYCGRKNTLIICLLLSGASCVGTSYLNAHPIIELGSYLLGKCTITGAFSIIYIFTAEMFPTNVRNTILGTCSMFARVGGMIAPFSNYLGNIYRALPMIVFGSLSLMAGICTLVMPETLGTNLPDTLAEAVNLSKRHTPELRSHADETDSLIENEELTSP